MAEWFPIDTAPEGVQILVWAPVVSKWDASDPAPVWTVVKDEEGDFYIEHDGDGGYMSWQDAKPTHWMPLPEPPLVDQVAYIRYRKPDGRIG